MRRIFYFNKEDVPLTLDYKINKLHANRKFNALPIQLVPFKPFREIELKISIFLCFVSCHSNYPKALFTSAS